MIAPEVKPDGGAPWPIQTRKEASQAGQSKYYTGRECIRKHVSRRYVSSGLCVSCMSARSKQFRDDKDAANSGLVPFNAMVHPDDLPTLEVIVAGMQDKRKGGMTV